VPPIRPLRPRTVAGLAPAALAGLAGLLICAGCSFDGPARAPTTAATLNPATAATTEPASPPTPSAGLTPSAGEACARTALGELTAVQRAGQLVMTGVPAGDPAGRRTLVRSEHLGSVFLAGRTGDSPATIRRGVARLAAQKTRTTTIELLVAVDQEGGKVQSLRGRAWTTIPAATVQGSWSTSKLTTRTTAWVRQLKSAGVNLNLAPVADTVPKGTEQQNPPIGSYDRQYGSTSTSVARSVATVSAAMRAGGVIPTVKHFPGLGRVRYNTDTSTRAVDRTTTVNSADLTPFRAGIDAGAGAVMISSARYPRIDEDRLAVFSAAVITDLLRTRMSYQGVVMTDDVGRAAAVKSVPIGQRATRFIAAGGDLVLTVVPEHAAAMADAIAGRAAGSPSFRAKVNASVLRVLRLKQQSGLLTCS
jgi:beta-N-acetylhexosaminidase